MCQKWDTSFGFDGFLTEFMWISQPREKKLWERIVLWYNNHKRRH